MSHTKDADESDNGDRRGCIELKTVVYIVDLVPMDKAFCVSFHSDPCFMFDTDRCLQGDARYWFSKRSIKEAAEVLILIHF